jgi:uncharacterized protein YkwD
MQVRNRLALLFLVTAIGAGAPAATPASADAATVTRMINNIRVSHGLRPLRPVTALRNSSYGWARRMMRGGFFAHAARPAVAHRFHIFGENIGLTIKYNSPRRMVRMWMNSPRHRELILSGTWRYIGAGSVGGTWRGHRRSRTWVLRFGR